MSEALTSLCGALLTATALVRLNGTVINALVPRGSPRVIDLLYQKRQLQRGPKVVAIKTSPARS
jgi:hypothetical protein